MSYGVNLIGDYDKEYLEQNRKALKDTYDTNWKRIEKQYKDVADALEKNRVKNQLAFNKGLVNTAEASFNRLKSNENALAKRGLTGSGLVNKIVQNDIEEKGKAVNDLLANVGSKANAFMDALSSANENAFGAQEKLNENLANALGNIGDRDLANQNRYNNAVANLNLSQQKRAANGAQEAYEKELKELQKFDILYDTIYGKDANEIDYAEQYANAKKDEDKQKVVDAWQKSLKEKAVLGALYTGSDYNSILDKMYRSDMLNEGSMTNKLVESFNKIYTKNANNKWSDEVKNKLKSLYGIDALADKQSIGDILSGIYTINNDLDKAFGATPESYNKLIREAKKSSTPERNYTINRGTFNIYDPNTQVPAGRYIGYNDLSGLLDEENKIMIPGKDLPISFFK